MNDTNKKRIPCPFPINEFYNFEDEIPEGTRISTSKDCENCCEECYDRYCLISE